MADSTRQSEQDNSNADKKAKARERNRRYRERHPDKGRLYYSANKEKILAKCKEYRERSKDKKRSRDNAYYKANKEKIAAWSRSPAGHAVRQRSSKKLMEARDSDPLLKEKKRELDRVYSRQYRQRHPERRKQIQKRYRTKHPEKCRESVEKCIAKKPEFYRKSAALKAKKARAVFAAKHGATYSAVRRKVDPQFRLLCDVRSRVLVALSRQNARRSNRTLKLVGCTVSQLMAHLEAKFLPGMSWQNKSEWHIDHIVPVSRFDLRHQEQQAAAFHYTNLQPLWAEDNLRKSNKVPGQHLFGFAYAARIASGDSLPRRKQAKDGARQHGND
jgi:hypothetical protein